MKRIYPLLLFIISLYGCNVKDPVALECIEDVVMTESAPAFYMVAQMPGDVQLAESCNDGCCALFSHPDYEIYQEVFPAASLDDALYHLTGQTALSAICTASFPHEQYRFGWLCAGETGTLACKGTLIFDGQYYHSLVVRCSTDLQHKYDIIFTELLSSSYITSV